MNTKRINLKDTAKVNGGRRGALTNALNTLKTGKGGAGWGRRIKNDIEHK